MPYKLKDPVRHKFEKKHYNKRDWKSYEQGLQNRGSITIWFEFDAIQHWNAPKLQKMKRGRQKRYSDLAIETMITLRLIYKNALRQTEGFAKSIIKLMGYDLDIPDHTTISRRSGKLQPVIKAKSKDYDADKKHVVIVDSTGVKVVGEKEWMHTKHGTKQRKIWRKLHIIVDDQGEILDATLTTHDMSDASQVPDLLKNIDYPIDEFIGDSGGYDNQRTYDTLKKHEDMVETKKPIKAIIQPNLGFQPSSDVDDEKRKENIDAISNGSCQMWQKKTDYGRRSIAEYTFYRFKTVIGRTLRSRNSNNQNTEVKIGIKILNKMNTMGVSKAQKAA